MSEPQLAPTRRQLLGMIGTVAGASAMYQAMAMLGVAHASPYTGPVRLEGDPQGATVLVLGAGLAGMVAAMELRAAGYSVQVLEYREKAGGRCWTLRGGDRYTELGGAEQEVAFTEGNYFNPGPWRIPYHHHAVLDYCQRLGVELEPFLQDNRNAYLHSTTAFDGTPRRQREISADYRGHVAELLSKVTDQGALEQMVSAEDRALLLESLRSFGALDSEMRYQRSSSASGRRGYERAPGGGVEGEPIPNDPLDLSSVLQSRLWQHLSASDSMNTQMPMFQPRGGMDMIAQAMQREVEDLIRFNTRVVALEQDDEGVTVTFEDRRSPGSTEQLRADYCVCTLPFSVLGQVDHNLSGPLSNVIDTMHYASSIKVGLEFDRRFWEEDEQIFGGITYTDLPISMISYPSNDYFRRGSGVLLGAYSWGATSYQFNALPPEDRIARALDYGAQIHPQYRDHFTSGVAVAWHRVPWVMGCYGIWQDKAAQYQDAVAMDRRVVMAGEHLSYLPAWMEGAILSSLDAISRLHDRVVNG
ncbi:flavin monoamine oxidase family protein [Plastorhodobacter daqingensis]|uniref:Tryptophan 2-monooxygenase n=1 Tax=Plastorhodobacter daqingensis TaxID=1387281 RepID=A0ABW2UL15_9RHOB